ncbi:MAG: HIT family protein [Kiritimatiellae bacterium]|nr:HIT family protein [Kiritimatiellia bacterium]
MSTDCIFCKIIKGEIPCTKVYEDDAVLVFMDIGPIIKGHALVVPKKHYDLITTTPIEVVTGMMTVVQKIALAQVNGLRAEGVNIIQNNGKVAGQLVPHVHVHVIPRFAADGHKWNWAAKKYESPEEMQKFAEAIKGGLK